MDTIFDFRDYKAYVVSALSELPRGARSRLSEALACHSAYVSQVLNGNSHLSLEQADKLNQFLGHNQSQSEFFLMLVQHDRAGTPSLKSHFKRQVDAFAKESSALKQQLEFKKTLALEEQATFYSSWQYGAIHVLVSVPGCNTESGISKYLGIPVKRVSEVLKFLSQIGLVEKRGLSYSIGTSHIHLGDDSPLISKHHSNWRRRALMDSEQLCPHSVHYTSVITCSAEDGLKIKNLLLNAIKQARALVKHSKDEDGFSYSIDFFSLKESEGL